jgi:iron complex transport system permease protein
MSLDVSQAKPMPGRGGVWPDLSAAHGVSLTGLGLLPVLVVLHLATAAPWGVQDVMQMVSGGETPFAPLIEALRLPRVCAALLGGASLALSGVVFQALTGNHLASPGVLGITSGANVGLVAMLLIWPDLSQFPALPAFLGGVVAACVTLSVARLGGGSAHLILAGLAVSLLGGALATALALFNAERVAGVFVWSAGDVAQGAWQAVTAAAMMSPAILLALAGMARSLDVLGLGSQDAAGLGVRVGRLRLVAGGCAVLLAALGVSLVGPIAFLGLIVPNALRLMGLHRPSRLGLPASLWGANLLIAADVLALQASPDHVLPAGLLIALIGTPCLIVLAARRARDQRGGKSGASGFLVRQRIAPLSVTFLLLLCLPVLAAVSMHIGDTGAIAVGDVWRAVVSLDLGQVPGAVLDQRLPRTVVAVLAGALLSLAGVMLQGVVRNPLAGPELLGLTQGAGLAALGAVLLLPDAGRSTIQVAAFIGAGATLVVVMAAAGRDASPVRLALIGVALAGLAAAVAAVVVVLAGVRTTQVLTWLSGTTYARGWPTVLVTLPALALWPLAWGLTRRLDLLTLGTMTAAASGVAVRVTRRLALGVAALASGAAVAAVGPVAFVGLIAPHAARLLTGGRHGPLLIVAPLLGGCLLALADMVGRSILVPTEIPAGIVTALIGAPYFLLLLTMTGRRA